MPLTCVWRRVSLELSALVWPCVRASCMVRVCKGFLPGHPDVGSCHSDDCYHQCVLVSVKVLVLLRDTTGSTL